MTCKPKVKVQKKSDGGSFFRCEKLTPEKQGPFKRGYGTQSPTLSVPIFRSWSLSKGTRICIIKDGNKYIKYPRDIRCTWVLILKGPPSQRYRLDFYLVLFSSN